ncbi:MAG TPA: hypothetical protein DEB06_05000, partial [Phycisphaerales bacterium]|nr:hypothetical protein [Phycisphaerales bacterium]
MLKFFRKYKNIVLVFGGTILMVLFLLPSGMSQLMGGGRGMTVARMDGRKISYADLQQAENELRLALQVLDQSYPLLGIDPRDAAAWVARTHEAEQAGLVGGPRDGRAFLMEAANFLFDFNLLMVQSRFGAQNAQQLLTRRDEIIKDVYARNEQALAAASAGLMTPEQAERALARAYGVYRMVQATNPSTILSRPGALLLAKQAFDTATVGAVLIPAAKVAETVADPTDEQIAAHFEKFRGVDPAADPDGVGYLQQARVVLEWLVVDRRVISDRIVLDPIEMNKFWRQNRTRFPGEFADTRTAVETAYRAERTEAAVARAEEVLRREMFRSTEGLPGTSRRRTLPPEWAQRMPSLTALAGAVETDLKQSFSFSDASGQLARAYGRSPWMDREALASLPGIGSSVFPLNQQNQIPFPDLVMVAQELGGDERFGVQVGLVYGPLSTQGGDDYYFRILEAQKQGPAESLDAVRGRVVNDLKILEALSRLEAEREVFVERARADGLSMLAGAFGSSAQWDIEVTAQGLTGTGVGFLDPRLDTPEFRDAVMGAVRGLSPDPAALAENDPSRFVGVVVRGARGLAVAQILKWRPATVEQYLESPIEIRGLSIRRDPETNPLANFRSDEVARRVGFKDIAGVGSADREPTDAEASPEASPETPAGTSTGTPAGTPTDTPAGT